MTEETPSTDKNTKDESEQNEKNGVDIIFDDNFEEEEEILDGNQPEIEVIDKSLKIFNEHKDSVLRVKIYQKYVQKNNKEWMIFATGSVDDSACLYHLNIADDSNFEYNKFVLNSHNESVESLCFSNDGKYLVTADLGGLVNIWDTNDGSLASSFATEEETETIWIEFHPVQNIFTVCDGITITIFDTDKMVHIGSFNSHQSTIVASGFCNEEIYYSIDEDCNLFIYNFSQRKIINKILSGNLKYHANPIVSCCVSPNRLMICTGDEKGILKVVFIDNVHVLASMDCGETIIECVDFSPDNTLIAAGSVEGNCTVWSVKNYTLKHVLEHPTSVTKLKFHPNIGFLLFTACADGVLRVWDTRNAKLLGEFTGHSPGVPINDFDFIFSKDSKTDLKILTASDDYTVRMFRFMLPKKD